ncbi:GNAT family N-acetyltransferase [Pontibacter vulgaris]|uniref:GNAT family N-acetyltransferase n=1 Tax=Pontibacter vulgaris TaxID=2905679 RepID=UPI001FA762CF|nr:GNAT family N-acetyltransferase [Pontibacter vulgaris]
MLQVITYSAKYKSEWDAFVAASKNGTFLLQRDYMDYHADRFTDHSLLFYYNNKLIALLPANQQGPEVYSHGGLSYGGIISDAGMKTALMLQVFEKMALYFREQGFASIKYKTVPHIYHQLPAEEDLYALFRMGASLYRRDINSVITLTNKLPYATLRKRKLKQKAQHNLQLGQSYSFDQFLSIQQALLQQKYKTSPAHTADEVKMLAARFPDNIKLFTATLEGEILGGILVYETATVAHCQYIAATPQGQQLNALDVLTDYLITEVYPYKEYFSFGVSSEQEGLYLNEGLIRNKESYGARAVVHDFYHLPLT